MKTSYRISLIAAVSLSALISVVSVNSQSPDFRERFHLGFFNHPYRPDFHSQEFLDNYGKLSLNSMQGYMSYDIEYDNTNYQGGFRDSLTSYRSNVVDMVSDMNSILGEKSMFLSREKINRPAYGQRSTYEAEYDSLSLVSGSIRPGYGYLEGAGSLYDEDTASGRNCMTGVHSPQYIVKTLYENREQVNCAGGDFWKSDTKQSWFQSGLSWYIKPRMRIPQAFANDTANWNKKVVRVEAFSLEGNQIRSMDILVRDFLTNFQYQGNYKENFTTIAGAVSVTSAELSQGANAGPDGFTLNDDTSKVDFRVYWYGEVDVWLDYVRVDDEWAHVLFNPDLDLTGRDYRFYDKLTEEVNAFSGSGGVAYFYMDEYIYNSIPCIAEVNRLIRSVNPNTSLVSVTCEACTVSWSHFKNPPTEAELRQKLKDEGLNDDVMIVDKYPFTTGYKLPHNVPLPDPTRFPGTTNYRRAQTAQGYNDTLNNLLISDGILSQLNNVSELLKGTWSILTYATQIHSFEMPLIGNPGGLSHREPTVEEISLQSYLALSYGAKQILHFPYNSEYDTANCFPCDTFFLWGMLDKENENLRESNYYGQKKWETLTSLDSTLGKIGKLMYDSLKLEYDDTRTVNAGGLPFKYIKDLKSIYRYPQSPYSYGSSNLDQTKYWEFGFFDPDFSIDALDKSKYFMAVNKRCTPEDSLANGDLRNLKIKFDSLQLSGFINWKVVEAKSNTLIRTFDKDSNIYVDMGIFQPGEGKLYKLAPMMQEGGTLVADEDCGGFEFECRGEVNNDGYDITIKPQTTILFSNTSARIVMNGGSFYSGSSTESIPLYLKAKSGGTWKGLKLTNCEDAYLRNTVFENISPYPVDSTYSVELTDCGNVQVTNCTFESSSTGKTGSLLLNYTSQSNPEDIYISSNTFKLNIGAMPSVSVISTGYVEIPMIMEWNDFESTSDNNTIAVLLSNAVGGAIKENNFTGYDNSVMMLGSSVDLYGNYILGSDESSKGIIQYSTSAANLSPSGGILTGGYNIIAVDGSSAACMKLDNSFLLIDQGYNIFSIGTSETGNRQLDGIILDETYGNPYPAALNCFKIGYNVNVKHNLKYPDDAPVVLDTVPASCEPEEPEGLMVFDLGNGVSDTLHYFSGGSGSGSGKSNVKLEIKNLKYKNASEIVSMNEAVTLKALNDSVSINLRKRNYERVSVLCREMLTDYADSINDASIISKLYLAELKLDTNQIRMSEHKSYLESYILNNPEKEMMIRQAFYFIQKCKVSLGLHESAMTGFQQIINQFPYSYEGLLASWDYAATSLLNSQGGSGGGAISKNEPALIDEDVVSYIDDPNDVYDSRKFTTDDRKTLNENLTKTFSSQVNKQTREIKSLEEKLTKNEASNSERKKYQEMRTLKEVVNARKPETIAMHVSMISNDLTRIMKSTGGEVSDKYEANILPTEFALHQNYPNPFNPATNISFDLPQDSKVNLVVYDLLGREVKRLVNNEFKVAGRYTYDFNGSSLPSGVYFYRLETEGFANTKRMMLVK